MSLRRHLKYLAQFFAAILWEHQLRRNTIRINIIITHRLITRMTAIKSKGSSCCIAVILSSWHIFAATPCKHRPWQNNHLQNYTHAWFFDSRWSPSACLTEELFTCFLATNHHLPHANPHVRSFLQSTPSISLKTKHWRRVLHLTLKSDGNDELVGLTLQIKYRKRNHGRNHSFLALLQCSITRNVSIAEADGSIHPNDDILALPWSQNNLSGNGMMLNALYSAMDGIIAMKRNTCAKAVYVGNAKALGPIGPRTGKAGWNHDTTPSTACRHTDRRS